LRLAKTLNQKIERLLNHKIKMDKSLSIESYLIIRYIFILAVLNQAAIECLHLHQRIPLCMYRSHKFWCCVQGFQHQVRCGSQWVAWVIPSRPALGPSVFWGTRPKGCHCLSGEVHWSWSSGLRGGIALLICEYDSFRSDSRQRFPWSSRKILAPI
jgi:hypothetical protein